MPVRSRLDPVRVARLGAGHLGIGESGPIPQTNSRLLAQLSDEVHSLLRVSKLPARE
jgi:hypothetical protein